MNQEATLTSATPPGAFDASGALAAAADREAPLLARGAEVGDFEILEHLGGGTHGQVYLARQLTLDRVLAVKIAPAAGEEGRTLARLNHPHIVAVYSEQHVGGLRLLAMQYVGGRTLQEMIRWRWSSDPPADVENRGGPVPGRRRNAANRTPPWSGESWRRWLDCGVAADAEVREDWSPGSAASFEKQYCRAACRVLLGVARALSHAHRHGVLHRDVKPDNILLNTCGAALLSDFHVAARCSDAASDNSADALIGGTLSYMAPEHLLAMADDRRAAADNVDTRADLYSLGVVLHELLTGHKPWPPPRGDGQRDLRRLAALRCSQPLTEPPRFRLRLRPDASGGEDSPLRGVSPALRAILQRLLAPAPQDRYQSADQLCEDLERWLDDRPLQHARSASWLEPILQWTRRRRGAALSTLVAAVAGVSLSLHAARLESARLTRVEQLLQEAGDDLEQGRLGAASQSLGQAQGLLTQALVWLPDMHARHRRRKIRRQCDAVQASLAHAAFGRFDQRLAAAHQGAAPPSDERLEDWLELRRRSTLARLDPLQRKRLAETVTELALLHRLAVESQRRESQRGETQREESQRTASAAEPRLIDEVAPAHRSLPLLQNASRQRRLSDVALPEGGDEFQLYLCGVLACHRGEAQRAAAFFQRSLSRRPAQSSRRFWAVFSLASCYQKLGRFAEAAALYGECAGQRPELAWPRYNLALAFVALDQPAAAREQFEQAIRLAPELGEAHLALGALLFRQGAYEQALRSCDRAIRGGLETSPAYVNRAAARAALGKVAEARADLLHALSLDPKNQLALENLRRLEGGWQ